MMVQNGAKLKRELAVYAVIPKLIPFFIGWHSLPLMQSPLYLYTSYFFITCANTLLNIIV